MVLLLQSLLAHYNGLLSVAVKFMHNQKLKPSQVCLLKNTVFVSRQTLSYDWFDGSNANTSVFAWNSLFTKQAYFGGVHGFCV